MAAFVLGVFCGFLVGWVTCALMVHAGRESDAMDAAARRSSLIIPRQDQCRHPGNCERQESGYCGRCHQELYP